ncbi:MAG: acetylornithine deacetylase [Saprospiraceae bacterium]
MVLTNQEILKGSQIKAVEILSKLVSFPVLGGESNIPIAEWIENYLKEHGVEFTNVPNEEGNKRSIHCRIGPAVDGGVILSGHQDVVPVEGQTWTTDPFVLIDKNDGKLYARGSCDMKGFLACCLAALPEMQKADLKKPIYFAFSYDEEIGCLAAPELAEHIKSTYTEKPKYAIIGEPSMMQPVVGQKGIVVYKTHVNGSAGHSSRIRTEVSAINEAARLILWLENKMNRLVEDGRTDERFTPPHTSIHCGIFEKSGIAPNIVADKASFNWDCRVIPMDKSTEILAEFKAYCSDLEKCNQSKFADFKIETELDHSDVPPLDTPEHLSIVPLIRELSGVDKLTTVSYAAEAGQFSNAGFETVICGPGDIAQAHRANEFIAKEQLDQGVEFMFRLVKKLSE